MTDLFTEALRILEEQAEASKPKPPRWATPGELAKAVDKTTIQTPALDLIDSALVDVEAGRCDRLIISMPPQEGKPVVEWAVILMGDGSRKRLADVQAGDTVITHLGRARLVTAVHEQGELPIVTITTHAGRIIEAALDHPFLTPAGWVNAGDLAEGDVLAAVRAPQTIGRATLTAEAARLMGYFVGDGSTTVHGSNMNAHITVVDPTEADDIERCATALGFGVHRTAKRVSLSTGVRPWLRQHGLAGCTSWTKRVPAEVFTQPAEIIAEFVGAYFACDGTVSRRGGARPDARVEFNSVSRDLLADVQHLLLRLGIGSTLRPKHTKFNGQPYVSYRLLLRRQDDVARFRAAVPFVHAKAQVLGEWPLQRTEFDTPYIADEIVSIERGQSAPCRCLTVDQDHTFTAEDVVVHNSTRVTKIGPLWMLTRNPDRRIAVVSYSSDLAESFGRDIRQMITQNAGQDGTLDLELRIAPDNGAISNWKIDGHRGGVRSVGLTGGLTGHPADVLFIDDPLANREQAESEIYRERAKSFWTSTGSTRLAPGAPVVLILTRWHEDDMAGFLLGREDGHRWRVINIPAQADHKPEQGETDPLGREPGEYMISARTNEYTGEQRTRDEWEQIKVQAGSRDWNALYQGRPSPDKGNVWQRDWWRRYDTRLWSIDPDGAYRVPDSWTLTLSWDMTFKDTKGSDYVVGQVWASQGPEVWLLDQVRARMSFTETLAAFQRQAEKWPQAAAKLVEDKANGSAVIDSLKKKIGGIIPVTPKESKLARASAVAPFIEAGNVKLPAPEVALFDPEALVDEAAAFPNAAHDDQVDAASQALARLLVKGSQGAAFLEAWKRRQAAAEAPTAPAEAPVPVPAAAAPARLSWRDRAAAHTARAPYEPPRTRPPVHA